MRMDGHPMSDLEDLYDHFHVSKHFQALEETCNRVQKTERHVQNVISQLDFANQDSLMTWQQSVDEYIRHRQHVAERYNRKAQLGHKRVILDGDEEENLSDDEEFGKEDEEKIEISEEIGGSNSELTSPISNSETASPISSGVPSPSSSSKRMSDRVADQLGVTSPSSNGKLRGKLRKAVNISGLLRRKRTGLSNNQASSEPSSPSSRRSILKLPNIEEHADSGSAVAAGSAARPRVSIMVPPKDDVGAASTVIPTRVKMGSIQASPRASVAKGDRKSVV